MNSFVKKIFKTYKLKAISYKLNKGMTYVELIVVLSIFSVMSSVLMFNHQGFQAKVDIKVLTNDIALKLAEAQKSATNGKWNSKILIADLKPTYGIYFDLDGRLTGGGNKAFISYIDLDKNSYYSDAEFCPDSEIITSQDIECLDKVTITKGNFIESITGYTGHTGVPIEDPVSIVFIRPNTSPLFFIGHTEDKSLEYIEIIVNSPENISSKIRVYRSGMIRTL